MELTLILPRKSHRAPHALASLTYMQKLCEALPSLVLCEDAERQVSRSSAVAAKSQTDKTPLAVKKAALRRERSPGRTTQCW